MGPRPRAARPSPPDSGQGSDSSYTHIQKCLPPSSSSSFAINIMISGFKRTQNWFTGLKQKKPKNENGPFDLSFQAVSQGCASFDVKWIFNGAWRELLAEDEYLTCGSGTLKAA